MAHKKSQGRGWHGDPEGHAKAGRLGGEKVLEQRGEEFYSEIGQQGGSVSGGNFKHDPKRASEAGKKGGSVSPNQNSDEGPPEQIVFEDLDQSI